MRRYRTLIVGGGPAGIATALFMAHECPDRADGIIVLEKARYPRDKYCAGAIGGRADRLLESIGAVVEVPSAPIGGIAVRASGRTTVVREPNAGRVVRRLEFDHALARLAAHRGIQIVEGVHVSGVRIYPGFVEVESSSGTYRGEVVVGADGVGSVVRRSLRVPVSPLHAQALEVDTEVVDSDLDRDVLLFDIGDRRLRGYYWDFPTVINDRPMVSRGVYYLRGTPKVEIQDVLSEQLRRRGLRLDDYPRKRYAERGFSPELPVARHRAILVGEAAGIDSVSGEGIAQAVQYGATAARYLARKSRDGDFSFLDWPREIRLTAIGRDLIMRHLALGLFYGARRASVERFLLDTPDFIRVGLQHFGGKSWSRHSALRGFSAAALAAMRGFARPPAETPLASG